MQENPCFKTDKKHRLRFEIIRQLPGLKILNRLSVTARERRAISCTSQLPSASSFAFGRSRSRKQLGSAQSTISHEIAAPHIAAGLQDATLAGVESNLVTTAMPGSEAAPMPAALSTAGLSQAVDMKQQSGVAADTLASSGGMALGAANSALQTAVPSTARRLPPPAVSALGLMVSRFHLPWPGPLDMMLLLALGRTVCVSLSSWPGALDSMRLLAS